MMDEAEMRAFAKNLAANLEAQKWTAHVSPEEGEANSIFCSGMWNGEEIDFALTIELL